MLTARAVLILLALLAGVTTGCSSPDREPSGAAPDDALREQPLRVEPTVSPLPTFPVLPPVTPAAATRLVSVAVSAKTAPFLTELDHYTATLGQITALSLDPNGNSLAAGGIAAAVGLWSPRDGRLQARLETASPVRDVAFAPDGTTVAVALESGETQLWDVNAAKPVQSLSADTAATAVAFHPGGQHLLVGYADGKLLLWEVKTGKIVYAFERAPQAIEQVAFSVAGRWLVIAAGSLYLYDLSQGLEVQTLALRTGKPVAVAFDRQERQVAVGGSSGELTLWRLPAADLLRTWPTGQPIVYSVAFSPDGETLATGSADGTTLWSTASGEQLRTLPAGGETVQALAFRNDGYILFAGNTAGTIAAWGMPVP